MICDVNMKGKSKVKQKTSLHNNHKITVREILLWRSLLCGLPKVKDTEMNVFWNYVAAISVKMHFIKGKTV